MNPQSSASLRFGQRSQLTGASGTDLKSLSTYDLPNSCEVVVSLAPTVPDIFILVKTDNTTPDDGVNVIAPGNGPGRWFRYSFLHPGSESCPTVYTVNTAGTGDYASPAAALAAANVNATAAAPVQVMLCPGTYPITTTLDITNPNVTIVGEQASQVGLLADDALATVLRVSAAGSRSQIENLFIFAGPNNATSPVLFDMSGASLITLLRCFLASFAAGATAIRNTGGTLECRELRAEINGAGATAFRQSTAGVNLSVSQSQASVIGVGSAIGRIQSGTVNLAHTRTLSEGEGWSLTDAALGYTEQDCNQSVVAGSSVVMPTGVNVSVVEVYDSQWTGALGSFGVKTSTGTAQATTVLLDDVRWGGANNTLVSVGSDTRTTLRGCFAESTAIPFNVSDTAQVVIADGQLNVGIGIVNAPATFDQVKWSTSGNAGNQHAIDLRQSGGSTPNVLEARQLMVRVPFAPCGFDDTNGAPGNWAWSDAGMAGAVLYIKTAGGWCSIALPLMGPCIT